MENNKYDEIARNLEKSLSIEKVGLIKRILCMLTDVAILFTACYFFGFWEERFDRQENTTIYSLKNSGLMMFVIYYLIMDISPLQGSLGKLLLGLKVVDEFGNKISFKTNLMRNLGRFFTVCTFFLGYLTILFRSDNLALHDLISSSTVVKER